MNALSYLAIDVDGLKGINDRGGHEAGDAALRAVGECLAATCRQTDLAARVGGDEFAVLVPFTTAEQALELAERLRALAPENALVEPPRPRLQGQFRSAGRSGWVLLEGNVGLRGGYVAVPLGTVEIGGESSIGLTLERGEGHGACGLTVSTASRDSPARITVAGAIRGETKRA